MEFVVGEFMKNIFFIDDVFFVFEDGEIIVYGKMEDWEGIIDWCDLEIIDVEGCLVFFVFCDLYMYMVFVRMREEEFCMKIEGLGYEEIVVCGGGIFNFVCVLV